MSEPDTFADDRLLDLEALTLPAWGSAKGRASPVIWDSWGSPHARFEDLYEAFRKRFLDEVYEDLEGQTHERAWHGDLKGLSPDDLRFHRAQLRLRLMLDRTPSPWLRERLRRIGLAISARTAAEMGDDAP